MKYILSIACIAALLMAGNAYSQEATASSNSSQVQGQAQVSFPSATSGAGAEANQMQSQISQGGSGGSSHSSNSLGINNSFNGSAPIRYLPVPASIPIENYQPAIFGNVDYTDKGPNFISMRQLIGVMNMVDLDAEVAGGKHVRIVKQMMYVPSAAEVEKKKKESKDDIKVYPAVMFEINDGTKVNGGFKPIATLSIEAEKPDKSNSASLAMAIGRQARELGATRVIFLTEGSSKEMRSSGWGIGFSYNYAQVNSDPSGNGSVGSGGFGYSQGKAGYKNLIYLTAIIGN